ncbi:unnamed protein product [Arabidopsis halleri]
MYVKCGDMSAAQFAFDSIPVPDDVAWTTMISGCIENGEEERAFHVFSQMRLMGVLPDEFTIATLAKPSSCLTALEQGRQIHANALKLNCTSDPFVGTSLVDMYAKCGSIDDAYCLFKRIEMMNITAWNAIEAENLIDSMSMEASASMYRTLLAACRVQGDTETGKRVATKLLELEPLESSAYVLLSNMYATASKWDEMKLARTMMKGHKVKKDPGFS